MLLTLADAMKPHRCPALLAGKGTAPKLATLRHGCLFPLSGCDARQALSRGTAKATATAKQPLKATLNKSSFRRKPESSAWASDGKLDPGFRRDDDPDFVSTALDFSFSFGFGFFDLALDLLRL